MGSLPTGADLASLFNNLTDKDVKDLARLGISIDRGQIRGTVDAEKAAREAAWRLCARSAEYFLLDSGFVTTLDNQKKWDCTTPGCRAITSATVPRPCKRCGGAVVIRDPIQPFPGDRQYMRTILQVLDLEPLVAIPKSRRMMMTELMCGKCLHLMMFRKGVLAVFQSDKEEKANSNVERVHGMWSRLPEWMKARRPANPTQNGRAVDLYMEIPANFSKLRGIPSGAKQIREMGPSFYFCDEAAFHADAMDTYIAVRQAIEAGCQAVYVSTAASGFFQGLCYDQLQAVG